jgi:WXG100 family type VII secretion target
MRPHCIVHTFADCPFLLPSSAGSLGATTIALDHEAFLTAIADVHRGAAVLSDEREAIGREVNALLEAWTGIAGDAFAEAWEEWQRGALEVLDGLQAMGRLLESVHDDLSRRDVDSQAGLDRITARLR